MAETTLATERRNDAEPVIAIDTQAGTDDTAEATDQAPVTEELLVEEISIDGMCGVY